MQLRKAFVALIFMTSPALLAACSDTASEIGRLDSPVDGEECTTPGEKVPAADGCNECSCADGSWSCTERTCGGSGDGCLYEGKEYAHGESWQCDCNTCTCVDGQVGGTLIGCSNECEPGDTKLADDGCNECSCAGGQWACTDTACTPDPSSCTYQGAHYENGEMFRCGECGICFCVEGDVGHTEAACNLPPMGATCTFDGTDHPHGEIFDCDCNICWCDDGTTKGNVRACEPEPGGSASCAVGDTVYPHGESWHCDCNTCSCNDGKVSTTLIECNTGMCVVDGVVYQDGDSFPASDGCNECTCQAGQVGCTTKTCDVCSLRLTQGNCNAAFPRFYFDAELGSCEPFIYGGCGGNANNFESLQACEEACPGGG